MGLDVAVKTTGFGEADLGGGHPTALVVTHGGATVGHHAHAVRRAESRAIDFPFLSIRRDLDHRTGQRMIRVLPGFGIIEVPLFIRLQMNDAGTLNQWINR